MSVLKKIVLGVFVYMIALHSLFAIGLDGHLNDYDGNVRLQPLTTFETSTAICAWTWPEVTLDIIDSHLPFIFRTKKSSTIDELKVLVNINSNGKIIGFDMLTENIDKGTKERVAHVLRKLPQAQPVPGFTTYAGTSFELLISY
jgi:hypothetical protein